MNISSARKSESVAPKRGLRVAAIASVIGCVACCAVPLLAAAGIGGGAFATVASVFRPGSELTVGAIVFVLVLASAALRYRLRKDASATCGTSCATGGGCCGHGSRAGTA